MRGGRGKGEGPELAVLAPHVTQIRVLGGTQERDGGQFHKDSTKADRRNRGILRNAWMRIVDGQIRSKFLAAALLLPEKYLARFSAGGSDSLSLHNPSE